MSERAVPFHCPYCGDEDLRPFETPRTSAPQGKPGDAAGGWECRSCLRAFSLKLIGLLRPEGGLR
ncbi:putative RNA-binding Zn-ribbon protein involved in translation (DUF1610 family) [Nocardioides thalensis]|uniref:Putative RNA-binding Zn-ribbon protein involved in translation (DUF1610 family) n=1 Tax=Nocardioides thalensis TaxID=1914755 RepID=A0A853C083_9ACTN|nr:hypothetical protein [Nocardioides thalensis]NYJ01640.1 putative RNA-binding Zn-ribbon protein involved in translation (DUF1610 family) [Nocardioides thalensis]